MSVIAINSATYCFAEKISLELSEKMKYDFHSDDILERTASNHKINIEKLRIALFGMSSNFLMKDIERQLLISKFKLELLKYIEDNNVVYLGFGTHLIKPEISYVLKVCLIAGNEYRIKNLQSEQDVDEKEAKNILKRDDETFYNWSIYAKQKKPTDPTLYDLIIPVDKHSLQEIENIILKNAHKDILKVTPEALQFVKNEITATRIKIFLLEENHHVDIRIKDNVVEVYLKKFVVFFEKYKRELTELIKENFEIKDINFKISKNFRTPSIIRQPDLDIPQKVLLVDDEMEFVDTLSERLKSRSMSPSIAYNGEDALKQIDEDTPEVMILDLKMPGINGLEVLKQVKRKNPITEVIILTGHGSEIEKKNAFELGAFAYLEKPVDINLLSDTMKEAYKKVKKFNEDDDD